MSRQKITAPSPSAPTRRLVIGLGCLGALLLVLVWMAPWADGDGALDARFGPPLEREALRSAFAAPAAAAPGASADTREHLMALGRDLRRRVAAAGGDVRVLSEPARHLLVLDQVAGQAMHLGGEDSTARSDLAAAYRAIGRPALADLLLAGPGSDGPAWRRRWAETLRRSDVDAAVRGYIAANYDAVMAQGER